MEIKTIIESLRHCTISEEGDCRSCPSNHHDSGCLDRLHVKAAAALESQQKRIAELEETVIHQRKRASDAEDFICMLCSECDWERDGDTIIMSKHCCELGMLECDKFKLRGSDPDRWIPVTERLPEEGERVLFTDGIWTGEGYINNRGKWQRYVNQSYLDVMAMDVTHWMPLPEPPKEVEVCR